MTTADNSLPRLAGKQYTKSRLSVMGPGEPSKTSPLRQEPATTRPRHTVKGYRTESREATLLALAAASLAMLFSIAAFMNTAAEQSLRHPKHLQQNTMPYLLHGPIQPSPLDLWWPLRFAIALGETWRLQIYRQGHGYALRHRTPTMNTLVTPSLAPVQAFLYSSLLNPQHQSSSPTTEVKWRPQVLTTRLFVSSSRSSSRLTNSGRHDGPN